MQLDTRTGYGPRVLAPLLPMLNSFITVPMERAMLESLAGWDGSYELGSITPTVFNQLLYELRREARADTVKLAWRATIDHLQMTLGQDATDWGWGNAHTLTHSHALAAQKPLDWLFNAGPFPAPGGHEVPNNLSSPLGPAPWDVSYGPSTRRVIDFGAPGQAVGINPVGQSGVLFDAHYHDQALIFIAGGLPVAALERSGCRSPYPQHPDAQSSTGTATNNNASEMMPAAQYLPSRWHTPFP